MAFVFAQLSTIVLLCGLLFSSSMCASVPQMTMAEETPESDYCSEAYETCLFKFFGQDSVPTYALNAMAETVITDPIYLNNEVSLTVLSEGNYIPEFIGDDGAKNITTFGEPPFSQSQFKFASVESDSKLGIAHEKFLEDQIDFAKNRCVRMFVSSYEFYFKEFISTGRHIVTFSEKGDNCVVFRTKWKIMTCKRTQTLTYIFIDEESFCCVWSDLQWCSFIMLWRAAVALARK